MFFLRWHCLFLDTDSSFTKSMYGYKSYHRSQSFARTLQIDLDGPSGWCWWLQTKHHCFGFIQLPTSGHNVSRYLPKNSSFYLSMLSFPDKSGSRVISGVLLKVRINSNNPSPSSYNSSIGNLSWSIDTRQFQNKWYNILKSTFYNKINKCWSWFSIVV